MCLKTSCNVLVELFCRLQFPEWRTQKDGVEIKSQATISILHIVRQMYFVLAITTF